MPKKSRKRRGGLKPPPRITKQKLNEKMLNEAIKKNAKKMLNVFHKVEKMFNLPNTSDKKLLKMFKEVKPKEIENLFDTPIKQSGKQSGGAIAEICEENRWENFSENQQTQLEKAYLGGIWDPYNRGGGGQFSCTNNGFGDIEDDDGQDIECACKVDPISHGCLEKNTMIESPGRGAEGATTCFNKENLALMYRRVPNMRGKNPLGGVWNAEETQWLIEEGVVPDDGDWMGEVARYNAYRALERRVTTVHRWFRIFMPTAAACIAIINLVLLKIHYDWMNPDHYFPNVLLLRMLEDFIRIVGGLERPEVQELVARRLWWQQQWVIIMQVWVGGAAALVSVILEIVRRSGIPRARIGRMGEGRMAWPLAGEPHPANPLAILAPGLYNRAVGPWRAPRRAGRRNQPGHQLDRELFYEPAGFPLQGQGEGGGEGGGAAEGAEEAAPLPPIPEEAGQQDENGQQNGGRRRNTRRRKRRKTRRRKRKKKRRKRGGVPPVQQAHYIHKPKAYGPRGQKLRASAPPFYPRGLNPKAEIWDGNTGYDKEVSNADNYARGIKPLPESHLRSGDEEVARRAATGGRKTRRRKRRKRRRKSRRR